MTTHLLETGSAPPSRLHPNRRRMMLDCLVVAVSVAVILVAVKLAWPAFAYWGDNANSFLPLWHMYGESLRSGRSFLFDHNGWAGGDVVGEAAYGLFNPVTVLNAVAISFSDELARSAFLLMAEFLIILAVGTYMLARSYGAARAPSIIAAVIIPFGGFTLYYEAGNWASGLMSITWVTHFWWSARAYSTGRTGPVIAVIFGALAATVGNPYAVLGILVVLAGLAVEIAISRNWRRLGGLVLAGACIGLVVLFVYLPLLNALPQVDRPSSETFFNDNYLSPSIGDLLGVSSPSYLPRMDAWNGDTDLVPSTYLNWSILALIPWLRFRASGSWVPRISLLVSSVVFLLFTLGPSQVWLFRWPIRLIEYSYVGLAVALAVLISSGLALDHRRRRVWLSGVALVVVFFAAWSSSPSRLGTHFVMTIIIGALTLGGIVAYRRLAIRGLVVVVILGTLIITPLQATRFGWNFQSVGPDIDLSVPSSLAQVRDRSQLLQGTVLQVADIRQIPGSDAVVTGEINFGNTAAAAGITTLNRYTGIHFLDFKNALQIDYRGSISREFRLRTLFEPIGDGYDADLVDALGVDTLVVSSTRDDYDSLQTLAVGWRAVEVNTYRTVLVRDQPLADPSLLTTDEVDADGLTSVDGDDLILSYRASRGGSILLDRLAWVGYSAQDGDRPLPVSSGPAGLLQVDVPAGSGEIRISYQVPGLRLGIVLLIIAAISAVVHQLVWRARSRRSARSWTPEVVDPDRTTAHFVI